ncbi:MAG: HAMP domain-containing sensor histidine kinase [Devosia sp.]|nr:HAMP domain-containing sensor histidine kinase [Devosia sp.]
MTIQRLIVASAAVGLLALALLAGLAVFGANAAARSMARLEAAEARAEIVAGLVADAHAYAEQVAAVLLFGKGPSDGLGTARIEMERALSHLNQTTRQQIADLGGMDEIATQLPEVDTTRRMIELYHAIDMSAARALVQQRDGKLPEAAQLFQTEVQFRLTNELQPLLENSLSGERAEAANAFAALQGLRANLLLAAGGIVLPGALALIGLAVLLGRAVAGSAGRLQFEMEGRTRQWADANSALRDIDERRSQLLADVSHQLRTPLTILRGEADVALRGKRGQAELQQALERVQEQAAELGQLLEDLIAYARSDAESHGHAPVAAELDAIVAAAVQEGQALAELREATIVARPNDGKARVMADPRRLRQALVIGLDNAIKHTPPGGRIDVATERRGASVVLRIIDQGPGIEADELPKVFERFFRGRSEAELLNPGLGIGLAIARQIVERHSGSIALANGAASGAVLEIVLPVLEEAAP